MRYRRVFRMLLVAVSSLVAVLTLTCTVDSVQPPPPKDETPTPPASRTFYVAPYGDNSNPGTRDKPWATPGYGSKQLQPGDTLIILEGRYVLSEYYDDMITPTSGRSDAWIVIKGEDGKRPVLVGRNNLACFANLGGCSYVRLENLEFTHDASATGEEAWVRDGVAIVGEPASNIVLKNLYIHHIDEMAVNAQDVRNLEIVGCRFEYCGFGAIGGPRGERGGLRNLVIRNCTLSYSGHYYQTGDGSNRPYDRPDGFGIEESDGPVLIEDCVVAHNRGDGIDSKAKNTTIRRCVVANNSCDGVKLWGHNSRVENTLIYGRGDGDPTETPWSSIVIDEVEQPGATFEIVNVTVEDPIQRGYIMYVQYSGTAPVTVKLWNTILSGRCRSTAIFVKGNCTLDAHHNLFYTPNTECILSHGDREYNQSNIGQLGVGNIYGDPLFVRPAWGQEGDYRLKPGSPAIDAGTTSGAPTDDLDKKPRDAKPDIGAYEF